MHARVDLQERAEAHGRARHQRARGLAAGRRHDAGGGGDLVAERVAEHDHPLADRDLVAVAQAQRRQPRRIDREQGQVEARIAADHPGWQLGAVDRHHPHLGGVGHDVVVGDHERAAGRDQEAGAEGGVGGGRRRARVHRRRAALDRGRAVDRHHRGPGVAHQIDERHRRGRVQHATGARGLDLDRRRGAGAVVGAAPLAGRQRGGGDRGHAGGAHAGCWVADASTYATRRS